MSNISNSISNMASLSTDYELCENLYDNTLTDFVKIKARKYFFIDTEFMYNI